VSSQNQKQKEASCFCFGCNHNDCFCASYRFRKQTGDIILFLYFKQQINIQFKTKMTNFWVIITVKERKCMFALPIFYKFFHSMSYIINMIKIAPLHSDEIKSKQVST